MKGRHMADDADRVKQARTEYRAQQKRIQQDRRLAELIDEFRANPFKLAFLLTIAVALLAFIIFG